MRDLAETGSRDAIEQALGIPIAGFGVGAKDLFGPACSHYHRWLQRLKRALDPDGASDPFFFVQAAPDKDA